MKRFTILMTGLLLIAPGAWAADGFGPMFSGTSTLGLTEEAPVDLADDIAAQLQNIEPAAGAELSAEQRIRVDNSNTIQIRPDESVNDIGRTRPTADGFAAP